ncbi:LuxR family transcriptional regulator [Streptomyces roseirectus]|nr:LuxR family transcriptional regulator [Streptomyces roseirectus]
MNAVFARCESGRTLTVILEGGAGCGKTALLDAFAHHAAEQGATVLTDPRTVLGHGTGTVCDVQSSVDRLADLACEAPVVVCHDDPEGLDEHGARLLLEAARRLRGSRVMLVLTLLPFGGAFAPALHRDLLRQPDTHRVRLRPLTPEQSREQWNRLRGTGVEGSADDAHAASGGNPLLLRALSEELGMVLPTVPWPQPHGLFVQTAVDCARDSGPLALKVATGMAALGEHTDPESVAAVLGLTPAEAAYGRNLLDAAGLVQDWRVRHPAVAAGLLQRLDPAARTALDTEVAELLHRRGTGAADLARHLLRTRAGAGPWSTATLERAAAEALDHDDADFADDCLGFAQQGVTDCWDHVRLELKRYAVRMRTDPWTAASAFLDRLRTATCPHGDDPCQARAVLHARLLMDCGRLEESTRVLTSAHPKAAPPDGAHDDTWPWILRVAPGLSATASPGAVPPCAGAPVTNLLKFDFCAAALSNRPMEPYEADEHLRTLVLGDTTLGLIVLALHCLTLGGCPDLAEAWAGHFAQEAAERGVEGWRQTLTAVRAQAALARGRLTEAEAHARDVLTAVHAAVPDPLFHSGVLAVLVEVCTATGRFEEAARLLERPLPEDFAQSVCSLGYLMARGRFFNGLGRPHLALADFLTVGRCAERWPVSEGTVPTWRLDAAETWLRIGGDRECADLLAAHEAAVHDSGAPPSGQWLRVRARLADRRERPALLARAVDRFRETSGGWILAAALADLAEAHQDLGQHGPAELALREALHLAEECRAGVLLERVTALTDGERPHRRVLRGPRALDPTAKLSESEQRVAVLAARGRTNREISEELFITVSTVEQHLTRVYRKLDITSRQELRLHVESALHEAA